MSANEEVEEHVHHAKEPFDKIVAGTMAIIAALLAVVSMLAQHYNTETVLNQQRASDQWSYYQAKDIRRYMAQSTRDSLAGLKGDQALLAKYTDEVTKYRKQADAIQDKAHEYEAESKKMGDLALHFDFGEVLLEIGIVFSSLSILVKRKIFFGAGVVCACAGGAIALLAHLI